MRVHPDADSAGRVVKTDGSGAGAKVHGGILGIDAELNGVALGPEIFEFGWDAFASGDLDLLLDQIDAVDLLGHGVLDLDPGVHLEEVVVSISVDEKLHRAGVLVVDGLGKFDGGTSHFFAKISIDEGGRCFFQKFLVPALDGAVALPEVDDLAAFVAEDLEFDVVRFLDVLLEVYVGVAEGLLRLHAGGEETFDEADIVVGGAHAFASATGHRLDHHWVADFLGGLDGLLLGLNRAIATRRNGDSGLTGVFPGEGFVTHPPDGFGGGTDEADIAGLADFGEVGVLRKKAVTRVDGIDIPHLGGGDDAVDLEVTLMAGARTDADGLIGGLDVERIVIRLGVDGERPDAEILAGTNHPKGDFAAVSDEDFVEHGFSRGIGRLTPEGIRRV